MNGDPLTPDLLRLEPLVFLADGIYGLSRRAGPDVRLVSALGVSHPLRQLVSARAWQKHIIRTARDAFTTAVADRIARRRIAPVNLLAYFVMVLVPRFERRDWGDRLRPSAEDLTAVQPIASAPDLAAAAARLPVPAPPCPGLLVLERIWRLAPCEHVRGMHVRAGGRGLAPTGGLVHVAAVNREWHEAVERLVRDTAQAASVETRSGDDGAVADAADELERTGAVRRGALLLLAARPPRIGHVMPPHFNVSLNRAVDGDVALTTPAEMPMGAGFGDLRVFARSTSGAWSAVDLPRGICLGPRAPDARTALDADLAALAYLRWAGTRVAMNGRFHEYDTAQGD